MSGMDHADLSMMDNAIKSVRDLHEQDEYYKSDCASCVETSWPCPTAIIVYTPAEVTSMLAAHEAEREVERKIAAIRREARQMAIANGSPLTMNETLMEIYAPIIAAQLSAPVISKWAPHE